MINFPFLLFLSKNYQFLTNVAIKRAENPIIGKTD